MSKDKTNNAIFCWTILELLAKQPMKIGQLKEEIRKDFPDRCVEDWEHQVRAALQSLHRKGFVIGEDLKRNNTWRLSGLYDPTLGDSVEINRRGREITITRIIRDTKVTLELKKMADYRCQICGLRIPSFAKYKIPYIEAHHIRPVGGRHNGSPDDKSNILILCPNHHAAFDIGAIALEPKSLKMKCVDGFNDPKEGRKANILSNQNQEQYLQYHLREIFNKGPR